MKELEHVLSVSYESEIGLKVSVRLYKEGKHEEAIEILSEIIKDKDARIGTLKSAYTNLMVIKIEREEYEDVIALAEECKEKISGEMQYNARFNLGYAYMKLKKYKEAFKEFDECDYCDEAENDKDLKRSIKICRKKLDTW